MPSFEHHRDKCDTAKCAQLALQTADPNKHADWIIITAFYQAAHWIEAFFALADPEVHPRSHAARRAAVNRHEDLEKIVDSYLSLYNASIRARYQAETYRDDTDEVKELLEEDLDLIVTHVSLLINQFQT